MQLCRWRRLDTRCCCSRLFVPACVSLVFGLLYGLWGGGGTFCRSELTRNPQLLARQPWGRRVFITVISEWVSLSVTHMLWFFSMCNWNYNQTYINYESVTGAAQIALMWIWMPRMLLNLCPPTHDLRYWYLLLFTLIASLQHKLLFLFSALCCSWTYLLFTLIFWSGIHFFKEFFFCHILA